MSDALSKFISGLQTLDANNLGAPQNAAALKKFQSLDGNSQKAVLNDLTGAYGTSFDELNGLSDGDKRKVMDNLKNGRGTFDGVTRAQQAQLEPRTFEQKWAAQAEQREQAGAYHPSQDTAHAERYGAEAARTRHGYQTPARQAQLDRIASIKAEAKASGKTFSEVADARVAAGQ
jgi:hypothetical protein